MKSVKLVAVAALLSGMLFGCSQSPPPSTKEKEVVAVAFPYDKAKVIASQSAGGAKPLGWHSKDSSQVTMFLQASNGSRWVREFVLIENETGKKWLMLIAPFGGTDTQFKIID
jgi:hypothetical protein